MKFAKTLEAQAQDLAPDYRPFVLSYKTFKKLLNSVIDDLAAHGLSPAMLSELQETAAATAAKADDAADDEAAEFTISFEPFPAREKDDDDEQQRPVSPPPSTSGLGIAPAVLPDAAAAAAAAATTTLSDSDGDSDGTNATHNTVATDNAPGKVQDARQRPPVRPRRTSSHALVSYTLTQSPVTQHRSSPPPALPKSMSLPLSPFLKLKAAATAADAEGDVWQQQQQVALSPPALEPSLAALSVNDSSGEGGRSPPTLPAAPDVTAMIEPCLMIVLDDQTKALCTGLTETAGDSGNSHGNDAEEEDNTEKVVTVPLPSDAHFFNLLSTGLSRLSDFQTTVLRKRFDDKLQHLIAQLDRYVAPGSPDYYTWRAILHAYIEAAIFITPETLRDKASAESQPQFARFEAALMSALGTPGFNFEHLSDKVHELEQPPSSAPVSKDKQQQAVTTKRLGGLKKVWDRLRHYQRYHSVGFHDKRCWDVLFEFLKFNQDVLMMRQFVDLNAMAVYKILKKHDKKTRLPSRDAWTRIIDKMPLHLDVAHELVKEVNDALVRVVPLSESFSCPVCLSLMYPPVQLPCGHTFCYPCLHTLTLTASTPTRPNQVPEGLPSDALSLPPHILFARYSDRLPCVEVACPLCRAKTGVNRRTMHRWNNMLHKDMYNALKRYFPKEVKQREREWRNTLMEQETELMCFLTDSSTRNF
ncbi:hypothetical protein RI367_008442 [Sorochytrium milnesiophthora]